MSTHQRTKAEQAYINKLNQQSEAAQAAAKAEREAATVYVSTQGNVAANSAALNTLNNAQANSAAAQAAHSQTVKDWHKK